MSSLILLRRPSTICGGEAAGGPCGHDPALRHLLLRHAQTCGTLDQTDAKRELARRQRDQIQTACNHACALRGQAHALHDQTRGLRGLTCALRDLRRALCDVTRAVRGLTWAVYDVTRALHDQSSGLPDHRTKKYGHTGSTGGQTGRMFGQARPTDRQTSLSPGLTSRLSRADPPRAGGDGSQRGRDA